MKKHLIILLCLIFSATLFAQQHTSVPLTDPVYYVIEQAELKGLCSPQGTAKPYSQQKIKTIIYEIFETDSNLPKSVLTDTEKKILQNVLDSFEKEEGIDWLTGEYHFEKETPSGFGITFDAGAYWESIGSVGVIAENQEFVWGTDNWGSVYLTGDMGNNFSWNITGSAGIVAAPRDELGKKRPYWGHDGDTVEESKVPNEEYTVYSEPLGFFPYTFEKRWDSSVFVMDNLRSYNNWPQGIAFGYNIISEMSLSFLDDTIYIRSGRLPRDWGSSVLGSSLVYNAATRPFLGIEATFAPLSWLRFSTLAGILEYYNTEGLKTSANIFQNAFSIGMVELNYKNYVNFNFGSTSIWPKRFEFGYMFPLLSKFFYQNNVGDFDNVAIFANLSASYPKIGKLWLSVFLDEADFISEDFFHRDRNMYAYQVGVTAPLPFLSFSNVTAQYTKIEPYTYTHPKTQTPWYGDKYMETAYVNNGESLGYYLPPNSDEIKLRLETMPSVDSKTHFQYQLIRHGADYGSKAVDGSSLNSEMAYNEIDSGKPSKEKHFLHDGAYQWQHVIKLGGEYDFSGLNVPVKLFGDIGVVYSYFTDVEGDANTGRKENYKIINTSEYPIQTRVLATLGVRIYP